MKKYTKSELKKEAQKQMKNQKVNKCFATEDGQFFILKNRAKLHAFANNKMELFEFENDGTNDAPKDKKETKAGKKKVTADAAIKAIEKAETVEEVLDILGDDKRKTVKDAADLRIELLNSSDDNTGDNSNSE